MPDRPGEKESKVEESPSRKAVSQPAHQAQLLDLPKEIILEFLATLSDRDRFGRFALVSKQCSELAYAAYFSLTIDEETVISLLTKSIEQKLESVKTHEHTLQGNSIVVEETEVYLKAQKLISRINPSEVLNLRLVGTNVKIYYGSLIRILNHFPNLKSLFVDWKPFRSSKATSAGFDGNPIFMKKSQQIKLSALPNLRSLSLSNVYSLTLFDNFDFSNIKELTMPHVDTVVRNTFPRELAFKIGNASKLEHLEFTRTEDNTFYDFDLSKFQSLQHLKITMERGNSGKELSTLNSKTLKYLHHDAQSPFSTTTLPIDWSKVPPSVEYLLVYIRADRSNSSKLQTEALAFKEMVSKLKLHSLSISSFYLEAISGLSNLVQLSIDMTGIQRTELDTLVANLGALQNLTALHLQSVYEYSPLLNAIATLDKLEKLSLTDVRSPNILIQLPSLRIKDFMLSFDEKHDSYFDESAARAVASLKSLESLRLVWKSTLRPSAFSILQGLTSLKTLRLFFLRLSNVDITVNSVTKHNFFNTLHAMRNLDRLEVENVILNTSNDEVRKECPWINDVSVNVTIPVKRLVDYED